MKDIDKSIIKKLLKKEDPLILDIGCYDGKDSIEFANLFSNPTIHLFDPDVRAKNLFDQLCFFNKAGKNEDCLNFHQIALTDFNGNSDFYKSTSPTRRHYKNSKIYQSDWSASSSIKKPKEHLNIFEDVLFEKEPIQIPSMRLDNWCQVNLHRDTFIDLIWADVNGSEKELIIGGDYWVGNRTKLIYIEFAKVELYQNQILLQDLLNLLYEFEVVDIFNEGDNFGNVLLCNKSLKVNQKIGDYGC